MDILSMINSGEIKDTENKRKLVVDGNPKLYNIYYIPINLLYYNDQNGRISTRMQKYTSEGHSVNKNDVDAYNRIIEDFIVQSKKDRFEITKADIKDKGLQNPIIILRDGRVIDGNRRFSCFRQLNREYPKNEEFQTIEAIVLDYDMSTSRDRQIIKLLEIEKQFGEDKIVEYDVIDELTDMYNTIVVEKLLDEKQYAKISKMSLQVIKQKIKEAGVMFDFLEFINQPEKTYIANEMKLDGPLNEIVQILSKENDTTQKEQLKNALFAEMIACRNSDITRGLRDKKDMIKSGDINNYIEKSNELVIEVLDTISKYDNLTTDDLGREFAPDNKTQMEFVDINDSIMRKIKYRKAKQEPLSILKSVVDKINIFDIDVLQYLDGDTLDNLEQILIEIEENCTEIKRSINSVKRL
ncbi:MAG: hypothetical protein RR623_06975 [Bacilli bacterium]